MARFAATELGADWVLNADADEFWWPRGEQPARTILARDSRADSASCAVRGGTSCRGPRRQPFFADRMIVRHCRPTYLDDPMATVFKAVHRATPHVRVGRGNHEAFADGLVPLRGWYPIEILHFPVRSREQCRRKYVTQYLALARNPDKGTPGQIVEAYDAAMAGRFDAFYDPLVVDDAGARARSSRPASSRSTRAFATSCAPRRRRAAEPPFSVPAERALARVRPSCRRRRRALRGRDERHSGVRRGDVAPSTALTYSSAGSARSSARRERGSAAARGARR